MKKNRVGGGERVCFFHKQNISTPFTDSLLCFHSLSDDDEYYVYTTFQQKEIHKTFYG